MVSAGVGEDLEVEAFCISTIGGDTDEHRAHQVAHHSSRHAWRHHLVVPPPIPIEDIARPNPLAESDPTILGISPAVVPAYQRARTEAFGMDELAPVRTDVFECPEFTLQVLNQDLAFTNPPGEESVRTIDELGESRENP